MQFQWSDNSPVLYTYWNRGEPNSYHEDEDCVHMYWDRVSKDSLICIKAIKRKELGKPTDKM